MATPRLRSKKLSEPTIARLPVYQRIAEGWSQRGAERIDSQQIGALAGVTATTVRRDLAGLGSFGTRGAGYDVRVLIDRIAEALGHDRLYDADPSIIGHGVAGHVVRPLSDPIPTATVGVICTPGSAAQEVADRLVEADMHAILNFAPQVVTVPLGTAVHYVDFSIELQILMYHLNNGTGPLGGGLLHSLGIASTSPLRGS